VRLLYRPIQSTRKSACATVIVVAKQSYSFVSAASEDLVTFRLPQDAPDRIGVMRCDIMQAC
jgi:hypothetical protein